jgi:hypothetical protein
MSSKTILN